MELLVGPGDQAEGFQASSRRVFWVEAREREFSGYVKKM